MDPLKSEIEISIGKQRLRLLNEDCVELEYPVSTAANGAGECLGSGCTPRGRHRVRIRIGEGCPPNAVFVGRRFTGEIWTPELAAQHDNRDWILTRILWLTGLETGRNRGGTCDTLRRYIYIHGTPDSVPLGVPGSHGCIRMRNHDLLRLFDAVVAGTFVNILE